MALGIHKPSEDHCVANQAREARPENSREENVWATELGPGASTTSRSDPVPEVVGLEPTQSPGIQFHRQLTGSPIQMAEDPRQSGNWQLRKSPGGKGDIMLPLSRFETLGHSMSW